MIRGRPFALLTSLLVACSGGRPAPTPEPTGPPGAPPISDAPVSDRLVVIHLPGVDPDLVERWRTDLPTLDRLSPGRQLPRVDFDPPGLWSVVGDQAATGRRAGAAGPLGGATLDRASGQLVPARLAAQARTQPGYWEIAARAGVPTRSLWMPGPLPPSDTPNLHAVPAELPADQPFGGICVAVGGATPPTAPELGFSTAVEGEGPWTVSVPLGEELSWSLEVEALRLDAWRMTIGGVRTDLSAGEISAPVGVALPDALGGGEVLVRVAATRQGGGALLSVLEAGVGGGGDRAQTVPPGFRAEWERFHGRLDTTGGASGALRALSAGLIGPGQLVQVAQDELEDRGAILVEELRRHDARLVVADLPEAGLVTQGLFGLSDSHHPTWSADLAAQYGPAPKTLYVALDGVLADVRRTLDEGDRLLIVSDHGVHSAHALVDLNAQLAALGRIDGAPAAGQAPAVLGLDLPWSRVRAWSTGPGYVYVNAEGRGPSGTVRASRVDAEVAALRSALAGLKLQDEAVVADVRTGAEVFPALDADQRPDLVVRFAEGFDVSPVSCHGGVGTRPISPNRAGVTGGVGATTVDLSGFAVSNFGSVPDDAQVIDLAPTVLSLLGVEASTPLDGKVWDIAFRRPDTLPRAP